MKINKSEIYFILIIVLLAFALRVFDILNFPWGLHVDEVENALLSIKADWMHPPIYFVGGKAGGKNIIFIYLLKLSREVFFGNTIFALRIVPVTLGTLTVLFYYIFNKQLLKKPYYALLATLPLCFSVTHIAFSRLALRTILVPLFIILIANLLLKFLRSKSNKYLYLYALFLGIGMYTYYSFLAVIPIGILVLIFLVYKKIIDKNLFLKLCFITLIVITPMLHFWSNPDNRHEYFRRSEGISITNPIWHHNSQKWLIKTVFTNSFVVLNKLTINSYTDERNNYRYQIPYTGMIDPFILILFITLLIVFIKTNPNKKDKLEKLVLGFMILSASALGAIITVELRGYTIRLLPTYTFILIFLSYLIYYALKATKKQSLKIFITLMIIFSVIFNFYSTFVNLKQQWATRERFDEDYYSLGLRVKEEINLNPTLKVYIPDGDERYKSMFYTNFQNPNLILINQFKVFENVPKTEEEKLMVIRESDFNNKVDRYVNFLDRITKIETLPKLRAYGFVLVKFR